MARKRKAPTEAEQAEALGKLVNLSGEGEDPAVRAMLSEEFVTAPDSQALDVALALQKIIRGQNSILENQATQGEALSRMRARMAEYDESARKWNEDREKFMQEITRLGDKVRATGAEKDKIIAKGALELEAAIKVASASRTTARLSFDDELRRSPKEIVVSPGVVYMVREAGGVVAKLFPEEIRIRHRRWVLQPGVATEVPKAVAEVLRQRRMTEQELAERKNVLSKIPEMGVAKAEMERINAKYGLETPRETEDG